MAKRSDLRAEFESEVAERVATKMDDPQCVEDNPGFTPADFRRWALEDIRDMGTDCGGWFRDGLSPRFVRADGSPDRAAQARHDAYLAAQRREHERWKRLRSMALRELREAERNGGGA